MSMARVAAASRRATPNARARRRMPRQDRKPCSGCGLCSKMSSQSAGGCWPDEGSVSADAADGPVGVPAMTGRHVIGDRRVLAVATRPHMHGDPLAPGEDLDGAPGEAHLDLGAREA